MQTRDNSLYDWLILYYSENVPTGLLARGMRAFETPLAMARASPAEFEAAGIEPVKGRAIGFTGATDKSRRLVDDSLSWAQATDQCIIPLSSANYPALLREIHDPPPFLFVKGNPRALLLPQMAIVGSRRCSYDGREAAHLLASGLSSHGLSICSGLAMGIDTVAHQAALHLGAGTVAVLGTGADIVYPSANRALAEQICEIGALVSELPLGSPAKGGHFPKRNRIISGMSLGVVVVEAALRSGSLVTARLAMEQNREVFAVPGSIRNTLSRGCHQLIRDGAMLVDGVEQIMEAIHSLLAFQLHRLFPAPRLSAAGKEFKQSELRARAFSSPQRQVMAAISHDPVNMDVLAERTRMPLSELRALLLTLELEGAVVLDRGGYVRR
jgi:DNA processing protein